MKASTRLLRPRTILVQAIALAVACGWAALKLPVEWAPSLECPTVIVSATAPGRSPRIVETSVTAPLERALQGIPGTAKIESHSSEGQAYLRLSIAEGKNHGVYVAEVADRLAALRESLPEHVVPRIAREVPEAFKDQQGFMILELVGPTSARALRSLADKLVAPRLRSLAGIAGVTVEGGNEQELLVTLEPDRLASHRLSVDEVRQQLSHALGGGAYGWIRHQGGQSLLWNPGRDTVAEVEALAVAQMSSGALARVGDLGSVALGSAPVRSISRVDGKPVVTLHLDRTPGSHMLSVAKQVRAALDPIRAELPPDARLSIADDRSDDVRRELSDLGVRAAVGLLGILFVLWVMLRCAKATGMVLFAAVLALAVGLALLHPFGLTLNAVTLAGLVLLVGLLVNNATVVADRVLAERHRSGGARAVRAVWLPLVGGTLTTMAVFLPMVYLSGELRTLFAPFAALSALTLACSLLSAALLLSLLGSPSASAPKKGRSARGGMLARWLHLPLSAVTRHPAAVLIILALVIGLPTSLLPDVIEEPEEGWESPEQQRNAERYNATLGRDSVRSIRRWLDPLLGGVTRPFLDEVELGEGWDFEERPEVTVRMKLPPGSGIARADERARAFEALALGAPTVRRVLTRVSEDGAVLRVLFDDGALDRDEPFALREAMIGQALEVAGMEISVSGLVQTGFYSGLGNVAGLPVEVYGPSYEGLEAVAQTFARRMARDPRVADVDTSSGRYGGPSGRDALRLRWGPDSVVRTSLGAGELTALLRSQLLVETPALYARLEGEPRLPVRLVTAGAEGRDLTQLLGLPLSPAGGSAKAARLDGFAELTTERDPPAIERKDQQYKRLVQVYYRGPHKLGKQAIDRTIRTMTPPPGYRIERPRYSFLTDEMRSDLIWLIAGTLALVYLVIAAVLESWRLAGLVMLSVPLAWVGIALGFLWSGESFGEGAFLGVVLVIGTSVNAGILLADRFRRLRAARPGAPARRLALLALRNRLRPIWTTTLTSVAGVLPLLLLPGAKSFWVGLAITVVGGLLSSALLAPVAMVALLSRKTKAPGKRPGARILTWEGEKAEGNQISFPAVEGVAARTGCR